MTHQTLLVYARRAEERGRVVYNAGDPALREPFAETSLAMHFRNLDEQGRRYRERVINGKAYRYYADEGRRLGSVWTDIPAMVANTPLRKEGTGYPTQKPEKLLDRIRASSREGQTVADLDVRQRHHRRRGRPPGAPLRRRTRASWPSRSPKRGSGRRGRRSPGWGRRVTGRRTKATLGHAMPRQVIVVGHDPRWPRTFEELRDRALGALRGARLPERGARHRPSQSTSARSEGVLVTGDAERHRGPGAVTKSVTGASSLDQVAR